MFRRQRARVREIKFQITLDIIIQEEHDEHVIMNISYIRYIVYRYTYLHEISYSGHTWNGKYFLVWAHILFTVNSYTQYNFPKHAVIFRVVLFSQYHDYI